MNNYMIINHNPLVPMAIRSNNKAEKALENASSKLSTGLRIRTAADDSANLGISEKMRAQIRGLTQASSNIKDGISLVQTADGALGSIDDPTLQRMRALAVQAANGTLTNSDREQIQAEVEQLKGHLDTIINDSEFNTLKIFAPSPTQIKKTALFPSPGVLVGDTILSAGGLLVTSGENRTMSFKLDGAPYTISLNPGTYTTPQGLLDEINQKMQAVGTDVTVSYVGQNIAFNSPTKIMDGFGGDMMEINNPHTSILYDMAKHGVISGASVVGYGDLSGGLVVTASNNTLKLTVDGTDTSITLAAGTYSSADLLTEINAELDAGNIPVTASYTTYFSSNNLQLMHDISGASHTLATTKTNIPGDAYPDLFQKFTTLTETNQPGGYTAASITGTKDLGAGVNIVAGADPILKNDVLNFQIDGTSYTVNLSSGTNLSIASIVSDLNGKFASNIPPLPLNAKDSSGKLTIAYNAEGNHTVNNFSGSACDQLLYGIGTPYVQAGSYKYAEGDVTPLPLNDAMVCSDSNLPSQITVVAGKNNIFSFKLDNVDHTITLDDGNYTASSFVDEINSKLGSLTVKASITTGEWIKDVAGGYVNYIPSGLLQFKNTNHGGGVTEFPYSLDSFSGTAYDAFMKPAIPIPTPGYDHKAYVIGAADLSTGLAVATGVNDNLTFKVNGVATSITLPSGTYSKAALLGEINNQLTTAGVTASYSGNNLRLTANSAGSFQIDNLGGNALDSLLHMKDYIGAAYPNSSSSIDAYIEGRKVLDLGADIYEGANDELSFELNGVMHSITLPAGNYDQAGLLGMVNQQLAATTLPVTASYSAKNRLILTYATGSNGSYIIDGVGGKAAYTLFYPGTMKTVTTESDAEPMKDSRPLKIQIGANKGDNIDTGIPIGMDARSLGIKDVDVRTQAGADKAIAMIDQGIDKVLEKRVAMGSLQNVLEYHLSNVNNYQEQLTRAESNIRNADVEKSVIDFQKSKIINESALAMIGKINQQMQDALKIFE